MNHRTRSLMTALSVIAVLFLIGCQPASKTRRLAFVTNNASDFWKIARKGTDKADAELANASVEFVIPDDGTAAGQKRLIDDLLVKGVDGIAISPVDPANQTEFINQISKQTLVITHDSDAPNSQRAVYIGTDNIAAGRQAGQLLKEALPQGGKIVIFVGKLDAQNAKERLQGIREEIAGTKIEIINTLTDDADHARAKANAADALVKHQDAAAFVGLWSYNGPAILNAIKEGGKLGKVKIVCFDEEDQTLAGVKDGAIVGTVVQQPYEFGYQAIKAMAKILDGDKSGIPASKQAFVPTLVIKKDNVEEFSKKLNSLLGRN